MSSNSYLGQEQEKCQEVSSYSYLGQEQEKCQEVSSSSFLCKLPDSSSV